MAIPTWNHPGPEPTVAAAAPWDGANAAPGALKLAYLRRSSRKGAAGVFPRQLLHHTGAVRVPARRFLARHQRDYVA